MKTTRLLLMLLCIALICSCRRDASPSAGEGLQKEYRMQVTVGPTTYWGMGAAKFAELVAEKTDGKVKVKPYYGSQLLKGAQDTSAQAVAMGSVDLALESTINMAPVIPEMNIFSLPFFVNTYENVDRMVYGRTGQMIFQALHEKGITGLAWGENGFRQLTNSRNPVDDPEDLKGMKVRVVGSPIFIDIFRALGADPVNMNWGDAVTAFQQRTVDAQENPSQILLAVQIDQYHKYMSLWNYAVDPLVLCWNRKQFESFSPDIQQAIRDSAKEAAKYQKALARAGLDLEMSLHILKKSFDYVPEITAPVEHLAKKGMIVTELTEAQRAVFVATTSKVRDRWKEKLGKEIVRAATEDTGGH